ncbi:hypothetical protein [Gorillibacterium timonense]|uniref:hypothetical protein n=1 Tax=Gorillibacterium timonense TaxID=1689269 RepID=UPI0016525F0F|nr:hypothetical protein [Gorillibacterium timonense]
MAVQVAIPQGEKKVTVELTVKEAMALGGYRFNDDPHLRTDARKRVLDSLDKTLLETH